MNSKDDSVIKKNIKWFRQLKEIVSYKNKKNINLDKYKRITEKINSLNPRQIALIDKFIKTL